MEPKKMCDASTQTVKGYWVPDSFFDLPSGATASEQSDNESVVEAVASLFDPQPQGDINKRDSEQETPHTESVGSPTRSPVEEMADPLAYLLSVDWAEETERELAEQERQPEHERLAARQDGEESRRIARERLPAAMSETEATTPTTEDAAEIPAMETPMQEARRRRNLRSLGRVIDMGSEAAIRELDDYLQEAEPRCLDREPIAKPTSLVKPLEKPQAPALNVLPVEAASWGEAPLAWDSDGEEEPEPAPATIEARSSSSSSEQPSQESSSPSPPREPEPLRLRPTTGARARRYNPNRHMTIDDLESPNDPQRLYRRPSVSPPPPAPTVREEPSHARASSALQRSARVTAPERRSEVLRADSRPRARSSVRDNAASVDAGIATPLHRGVAHSRGDPITSGVMFGHLEVIQSNHDLDPPHFACYNCWGHGHNRTRCTRPVTFRFCVNCGRKDVKIEDCPRCGLHRRCFLRALNQGLSHEEAQREAQRQAVERRRRLNISEATRDITTSEIAPSTAVLQRHRPAYADTLGGEATALASRRERRDVPVPLQTPQPPRRPPAATPATESRIRDRSSHRSPEADRALVERIIDLSQRIPPSTIDAVLSHLFPREDEHNPRRGG